jgi:RNA polymerase sigma factor (sigma-70 family)
MVSGRPAPVAVAASARQEPPVTPEELFRTNLRTIDDVIRFVAQRSRLSGDERDEFAAEVHLKLLEHDCKILRRFEHRANLKTFLVTVIQRLFLDFRNRKWGKWRSSAAARRLGPLAQRLERLVYRDGLTFDEAVGVLTTGTQDVPSREALYALFQELPPKQPRRFVSDQTLDQEPVPGVTSEEALVAQEAAEPARRARLALAKALATLSTQDQLLITLHYVDHMTVTAIARLRHLEKADHKRLYRQLEEIRQTLRALLEADGVTLAMFLGAGPDEDEPQDE